MAQDEPGVLKVDSAAAMAQEMERQDASSSVLGPFAIKVVRRPLYLGRSGVAS